MLKLKLQYLAHLLWRTDSLEKTLMLGKIAGRRRRGCQRIRWLNGITNSMDMNLSSSRSWWWSGKPDLLQSMGSQSQTQPSTELNWLIFSTLTIVCPQSKHREGTQPSPSTENWIKDLLSNVPSIITRPSQSFPSGSFHKPLILIHQKTERMKIAIIEN